MARDESERKSARLKLRYARRPGGRTPALRVEASVRLRRQPDGDRSRGGRRVPGGGATGARRCFVALDGDVAERVRFTTAVGSRRPARGSSARWSSTATALWWRRARTAAGTATAHLVGRSLRAAANWSGIVDRTTTEKLRLLLLAPSRAITQPARVYELAGFVRCGQCGEVMLGRLRKNSRGHTSRGYISASGPGRRNCGGCRVVADPIEEAVSDQVLGFWSSGSATVSAAC